MEPTRLPAPIKLAPLRRIEPGGLKSPATPQTTIQDHVSAQHNPHPAQRPGQPRSPLASNKRKQISSSEKKKLGRAQNPPSRKRIFSYYDQNNLQQKNYKTEMCKNFQFLGACHFDQVCKFAHGEHELRLKKETNLKYKSKPCIRFNNHHFCSYGYRCQYQHEKYIYSSKLAHFVQKLGRKLRRNKKVGLRTLLAGFERKGDPLAVFWLWRR